MAFFKVNFFEDFISNEAQPQLKTLFKCQRSIFDTLKFEKLKMSKSSKIVKKLRIICDFGT